LSVWTVKFVVGHVS